MSNNATLDIRDTISGSAGSLIVTMNNKRYTIAQIIKCEAKFKKTKKDIPIMGRPGKGHKTTGWSGEGTMSLHYNTSIFREAAKHYADTNEETYFDAQVENEDSSSSVGRQSVILKDCSFDEVILALIDADADYLKEDMSFTFEDFEIAKSFNLATGMLV